VAAPEQLSVLYEKEVPLDADNKLEALHPLPLPACCLQDMRMFPAWRPRLLLTDVRSTADSPAAALTMTQIKVEEGEGGDQVVTLHTTLPGRLLLHWGVEGGADYKGGWRLPGQHVWPEGTVQYKDRALQTPWRCVKYAVCAHTGRKERFSLLAD
jgi:hypothetical protein